MGPAGNSAQTARRPALRQRLSVRRDLSGAQCRSSFGFALRRHRHDAASPRRNLTQCGRRRRRWRNRKSRHPSERTPAKPNRFSPNMPQRPVMRHNFLMEP